MAALRCAGPVKTLGQDPRPLHGQRAILDQLVCIPASAPGAIAQHGQLVKIVSHGVDFTGAGRR
jgi:hypothetical protein